MRLSLCLNCAAAAAFAADRPPGLVERRLAAMGTVLDLSVEAGTRAAALDASEGAAREISRVEEALTTWRAGGPLAWLNAALPGEPVALGREVARLLETVLGWSARTGRAFDPTVLPLVRAWGLRSGGRIPSAGEISRALGAEGPAWFSIDSASGRGHRLSAEAGIDEGAWGKGYALDRAVEALEGAGVRSAVVDLGGQASAIGPAVIAIADPRNRSRILATLDVADASVSTSGNSERGLNVSGRRIGHLLDPRTGQPAADFGSVTVVAPSGLVADVLSTAFFVLGPERGLEMSRRLRGEGFPNEALFLIVRDGRVEKLATPGLKLRTEEE